MKDWKTITGNERSLGSKKPTRPENNRLETTRRGVKFTTEESLWNDSPCSASEKEERGIKGESGSRGILVSGHRRRANRRRPGRADRLTPGTSRCETLETPASRFVQPTMFNLINTALSFTLTIYICVYRGATDATLVSVKRK